MPRSVVHRFWRSSALPYAEFRCANDSSACYAPHAHAALSVGAVDGGRSVLTLGGKRQQLVPGDVVLIPPDAVHCCNPQDDGRWSYQMLYLDGNWLEQTIGTLPAGPGRLPAGTATATIHARLTRLGRRLLDDGPDEDKEAALVLFAGDLLGQPLVPAAVPAIPADERRRLEAVRALIAARCGETLRLDELAAAAAMGRYQLLRAFRDAFGMTPHAWQLDLRIQRARRLLDTGVSLAEAALQLGFADQSHFQRAFKERVAATPGEYRQAPQFSSRRPRDAV